MFGNRLLIVVIFSVMTLKLYIGLVLDVMSPGRVPVITHSHVRADYLNLILKIAIRLERV